MSLPPWRTHAPIAFMCFDRAEAVAAGAVDAALLDPVRASVAATLMHPAEHDRTPLQHPTPDDPRAPACVLFAEQFVVDVAGTTDAQRAALGAALGDATFPFVQALYVVDVFQRGRIALERIFATPFDSAPDVATGDLWGCLEEFMRVVALGTALDPVTTELVRLHGARAHNCRVCQSRLSLKAIEAAGDPAFFAGDAHAGAALEPRQRAALALTDALVTQPMAIDTALTSEVRDHFDDAEVVEIVLDVVRNGANKIAVALGGDAAVVNDGFEYYDVDSSGEVVASVDRELVRAATT
jgi:alkylhydroperoxidase family enzyme